MGDVQVVVSGCKSDQKLYMRHVYVYILYLYFICIFLLFKKNGKCAGGGVWLQERPEAVQAAHSCLYFIFMLELYFYFIK